MGWFIKVKCSCMKIILSLAIQIVSIACFNQTKNSFSFSSRNLPNNSISLIFVLRQFTKRFHDPGKIIKLHVFTGDSQSSLNQSMRNLFLQFINHCLSTVNSNIDMMHFFILFTDTFDIIISIIERLEANALTIINFFKFSILIFEKWLSSGCSNEICSKQFWGMRISMI